MLTANINIKDHQQFVTYRQAINTDTDIVFDITFDMSFNVDTNKLMFTANDSKVYLEKDKNKFHIKHAIKSNTLNIDGFSLWMALDMWIPEVNINSNSIFDGLAVDKLTIVVSPS